MPTIAPCPSRVAQSAETVMHRMPSVAPTSPKPQVIANSSGKVKSSAASCFWRCSRKPAQSAAPTRMTASRRLRRSKALARSSRSSQLRRSGAAISSPRAEALYQVCQACAKGMEKTQLRIPPPTAALATGPSRQATITRVICAPNSGSRTPPVAWMMPATRQISSMSATVTTTEMPCPNKTMASASATHAAAT
jgi:hypothetical protein